MPSKITKMADKEHEMEFTSMIDVVFLLLIFFMCATRFKQVEQKLDCFLPTDEGQMAKPTVLEKPEEVTIFIKDDLALRESSNFEARVRRKATYYMGSRQASPIADMNELYAKIKPLAGNPEQEVLISLYDERDAKDQLVPFGNVIKVVDVCKHAGIQKIKFQAPAQ